MSAVPAHHKRGPAEPSRPAVPERDAKAGDRELAEALRLDPSGSAEQVHERFAPEVNRLVWRLLGADADHHDIVQQVFLKLMTHGRRLREPERLSAWVQKITVNTVYEELRKRDLRRLLQRDVPVALHSNLVQDVESRDLLLRAKSILEKLPAKERIVFVLHHVEGRNLAEVAELCSYSIATAKRRLRAANGRFERLVAAYPELARMFSEERGAS